MKQSRIIISVIVAAAVLLAAFGLGFYIGEARSRRARIESEVSTGAGREGFERRRMPGRGGPPLGGFRNLSAEEEARLRERWESKLEQKREEFREKMRERKEKWENMSEEEKEKFRAEMRERFSPRGRAED